MSDTLRTVWGHTIPTHIAENIERERDNLKIRVEQQGLLITKLRHKVLDLIDRENQVNRSREPLRGTIRDIYKNAATAAIDDWYHERGGFSAGHGTPVYLAVMAALTKLEKGEQ